MQNVTYWLQGSC